MTIVTTSVVVLAGSSFSTSSQAIWSILNQYQLIILLPFLRGYLSDQFKYFINGYQAAFFKFTFLNPLSLPVVSEQRNKLTYDQPDPLFAENGFESGSYIINQMGLIIMMSILVVCHLLFLLSAKLLKYENKNTLVRYFHRKIKDLMHFDIYIKVLLEAFVFNFLAALSEVSRFSQSKEHFISYGIACTSLFLICTLILLVL